MENEPGVLARVRSAAKRRILYLPHAIEQMMRPDRMIRQGEVRLVAELGELVEDYPNDARGHSCLLLGWGDDGRPIHVVCAPKGDCLAIITPDLPVREKWANDFKTRLNP